MPCLKTQATADLCLDSCDCQCVEYAFVGYYLERDLGTCEHGILVCSGENQSRGSADARSEQSKGHRPSRFILAVARKTFQNRREHYPYRAYWESISIEILTVRLDRLAGR